MVNAIGQTTIESMLRDRQALIGTPDDVIEQLRYHIDVFGHFEPSLQINFGGTAEKEALRTLEIIARDIMPEFAGAEDVKRPA